MNVLFNREQYQNMILKDGMRYHSEFYIINYAKKDEYYIIESLSKYTHNFIMLEADDISSIKVKEQIRYHVDKLNCDMIFNGIFSNFLMANMSKEKEKLDNDGTYLLFLRSKNENGYNQSHNIRKFQFKYLADTLHKFYYDNYSYHNGWGIPKLSNQPKQAPYQYQIIENGKVQADDSIVVVPLSGIGDYMMFFSMLYEFFQRKRHEGMKVYIATYQDRRGERELLKSIFPEINILLFDNEHTFNYCISKIDTTNLLSMLFMHISDSKNKALQDGCHITETFKSRLGLEANYNPYKHSDIFKACILNSLEHEEKRYIDYYIANKEYIGIQFFTGIYDEVYNIWSNDCTRVWKEEYVKEFIKLCKKGNVKLLIVGSSPYKNLNCDTLGQVSTTAYIYAVSKLKMTVGIDSSTGHIAALYGIPNITIWGKQTPFNLIGNLCSFRSLTKNISICSKEECIDNISPQYVYDIMKGVLNGNIEAEEQILSYYDTKRIYMIE